MEFRVRVTLTEEMLGTASANKDVHEKYIASKAPDALSKEEEIEMLGVDEVVREGMTIFPRDAEGNPIMWDYQIKGFFKDACGSLKMVAGTKSAALKAYKKRIDGLVFVNERQIPINLSGAIGNCQRPLRAQTMQGERVALANSETVPAGSTMEFTINLLDDGLYKTVIEWLDYGKLRGLGQWRNASKGRFNYEII